MYWKTMHDTKKFLLASTQKNLLRICSQDKYRKRKITFYFTYTLTENQARTQIVLLQIGITFLSNDRRNQHYK